MRGAKGLGTVAPRLGGCGELQRAFRTIAGTAGALTGFAAFPALVEAHGLVGRADLPVPSWLFGWAAAIVLAASFVALASLWPTPRLQVPVRRRLVRVPAVLDVFCGALGILVFIAVVYAGFAGTAESTQNLAPNVVYVEFWVGLVVASLLLGDIFRAFSPWRALVRAAAFAGSRAGLRRTPRPYPAWLGHWPAVAGIVCFAWLELVYVHKADPPKLAVLALVYAGTALAGMWTFGIQTWSRSADPFGVYFGLYARLSVFEREDGVLYARRPLSGAPSWPLVPGSVALLCVAIGSTTFDGFSNGPVWASLGPDLQSLFRDVGFGVTSALELAGSVGLAGCILLVGGFYNLGVRGMESVGSGHSTGELLGRFVHTLIPIAFAYALAHYFSLLVYQGQAVGYLVSDPLGDGSNLFGTAHSTINYNIISGAGIWYVQVGALVCGHVAGLVLAHDRALAVYARVREATRSQYWMLVIMVGFTSLGLWLLSAVRQ